MKITLDMVHPDLIKRAMDTRNSLKIKNQDDAIKKYLYFKNAKRLATPKDIKFEERFLKRKDGTYLRLCIYSSKSRTETPLPGVLWCHGGGFVMGYPELDKATYKRLIDAYDSIIVVPEYRLALEEPYPAALEDVFLTLCWMNNQKYISKNIVGGVSSGGGLAVSLTLYARDMKGPKIDGLMPLYPMLDYKMDSQSMKNNNAPVWDEISTKVCWKLYLQNIRGKIPCYASPLEESNFSNFPPVISFVGTIDPFYDETKVFIKRLKQCEVDVVFKEFKGCFHGFELEAPKTAIAKEAHSFLVKNFYLICNKN